MLATVDWELAVVLLCMCLSFLFSASETALTSLGKLEAQTLISQQGRVGKLIQMWTRDERRWLTTALVGNNVANIVASSVLALWANRRYPTSVSVIIASFTLLVIIFSEIIPKIWANEWSTRLAPASMRFLRWVDMSLRPLTATLGGLVSLMMTRKGTLHLNRVSEEELEQTIEMATKGGDIDREMGEALANVIDFPDLVARDVMLPRSHIQAISVSSTLDEVLRFVVSDGHSRYPVIRDSLDNIVGILLVRDLLLHLHRASPGSWTRVVRKPYFISELTPLKTVLRNMKRFGAHMALVCNETGVLTGLLTLEEILEEIVGEIRDETDDPAEAGFDASMGPRVVSGEIPVVEFNERHKASLPLDVAFSTLNGYLLSRTGGQLPPVGTLVFGDDVTFRIHSVSDQGIATVELIDIHST